MKRSIVLSAIAALLLLTAPPALAAPTGVCYLTPTSDAIRNALANPACMIINLAPGVYKEHSLRVQRSVFIQGAGKTLTIIDAQSAGGVLDGSGATLQMSGMTIRNGALGIGGRGGAIVGSYDHVVFTDMIFINNRAGVAGAVDVEWSQEVTIQRTTFKSNHADCVGAANLGGHVTIDASTFEGNGAARCAGAIYAQGGLDISRSTFKDNQTEGEGGALSTAGPSLIEASTFTTNRAVQGGAISSTGDLVVRNSKFIGNQATTGSGGAVLQLQKSLQIHASTFTSNTAAGGQGGAIFGSHMAQAAVKHSTFNLNKAVSGGAVAFEWTLASFLNSTFSGNTATAVGGGLYANGFDQRLSFMTFSGNRAPAGGSIYSGGSHWATLKNTILNAGSVDNCAGMVTDGFLSLGGNFSSDHSCDGAFDQPTDRKGVNPRLGLLAANGGKTKTHALLLGSPAINKAVDCKDVGGTTITVDQRFTPRPKPVGGKCDSGAYEK